MAKTLEEVLAVPRLTADQKARAKEWFKLAYRTQPKGQPKKAENEITMDVESDQQVKDRLNALIAKYNARKAKEDKKKAAEAAEKEENEIIYKTIKEAKKLGFTVSEICANINNLTKDRKKAALEEQLAQIQAQIAELG